MDMFPPLLQTTHDMPSQLRQRLSWKGSFPSWTGSQESQTGAEWIYEKSSEWLDLLDFPHSIGLHSSLESRGSLEDAPFFQTTSPPRLIESIFVPAGLSWHSHLQWLSLRVDRSTQVHFAVPVHQQHALKRFKLHRDLTERHAGPISRSTAELVWVFCKIFTKRLLDRYYMMHLQIRVFDNSSCWVACVDFMKIIDVGHEVSQGLAPPECI